MTATAKRRGRPPKVVKGTIDPATDDGQWLSNDDQEHNGDDPAVKQRFIEGTEPVSIPEIDKAAEEFVEIRNRWQAQGEEMNASNDLLRELMQKHGLTEYRFDSMLVKVEKGKERAKVNRIKETASDSE